MNTDINIHKTMRNYSITNEDDKIHLNNNRCPTYALTWNAESHSKYWEQGHDYFIGTGENITDNTKEIREILSVRLKQHIQTNYILFCDFEGVLVQIEDIQQWMPKGKEIWSKIQKYHPIILSSSPERHLQKLSQQKKEWCKRELGEHVQIITCPLREKSKYCLYSSILIDDRINNSYSWNDKGGKFIIYDENYQEDIIHTIDTMMETVLLSP